MNTTYATSIRVRRVAAIVIAVALTLSFAAIATLGAASETGGGIFASLGDYVTQLTQALGAD